MAPPKSVEMMGAVDLVGLVLLANTAVEVPVAVCQIVLAVNAAMMVVVALHAVCALPHKPVPTVFVLELPKPNVQADNAEIIVLEEAAEAVPMGKDAEPDNVNVFMIVKKETVETRFNSRVPIPDCVLQPLVDHVPPALPAEITDDVLPSNSAPLSSQLLNVLPDVLCLCQLQWLSPVLVAIQLPSRFREDPPQHGTFLLWVLTLSLHQLQDI